MKKLIMTFAALSAALLGWAQPEPSSCVDEFGEYTLVYAADLPASYERSFETIEFPYSVNRSKSITKGSFDRIGYWMQLTTKNGGAEQYVWVSMDAFTDDAALIGVPTSLTGKGAVFQQYVENLHVRSNVDGVRTGDEIGQGNIEFWPNNYSKSNAKGIPGASGEVYDFGDQIGSSLYGQMEVADYQNGNTIFNYTMFNFKNGTAGLGIGNRPTGGPDWTESNNGATYSRRRLEVYVRLAKSGAQPLELVSAELVSSRQTVALKFSAPLAATDFGRCVTLDNAVVRKCELCETDPSLLYVRVARVPADVESLNVTVKGLADTSASGNTFAGGSVTRSVTFAGLPAEVVQNVPAEDRAGYELVYSWDIPCADVNYAAALGRIPYDFAQGDYSAFYDRVAYYFELTKADGTVQWVWTSMDDWAANDLRKIGVPIDNDTSGTHGCFVKNLDVLSNVDGLQTGRDITQGNVEFWYDGIDPTNSGSIPGANASKFDFGDRRSGSFTYGQMQVHNYLSQQTVFAINHYCSSSDALKLMELGIGNDPDTGRTNYHPDWVQSKNGDSYEKRVLHVMVRPVQSPAAVLANVDEAKNYSLLYTIDLPEKDAKIVDPESYARLHVVNNASRMQGRSIKRVAYYLELEPKSGSGTQWCWTSFDTWTQNPKCLSVPIDDECLAQRRIANLNVRSNVSGVKEVTDCQTGNIEWFPYNSSPALGLNDPDVGGSATVYDWNDKCVGNSSSAACAALQVHNWGDKQTLISVGHLNGAGSKVSVGIGNRPNHTDIDWTLADNAADFTSRKLHILVQLDETKASELIRAVAATDRRHVCAEFADKVSGDWSAVSTWTLANGPDVIGARISSLDEREVVLTFADELEEGSTYALSGKAGAFSVSATVKVADAADVAIPAAVVSAVSESGGYRVVKFVDAPSGLPRAWGTLGVDYDCDESRFAALGFDRVAYLVQVDKVDGSQWVWTSMDAYTKDAAKLGPSSLRRQNEFVCYVDNLRTACGSSGSMGVPDVVAGESEKGNLEMVWSNHSGANSSNIPGATSAYDFGDSCAPGGAVGFGCFSVNDYLNKKVVFNLSHFAKDGFTLITWGLGTQSSGAPDWTENYNATQFTRRRLWVLVRASSGAGPVFAIQPQSKKVKEGKVAVLVASADGAVRYQWRKNGVELPGETYSTLVVPAGEGGQSDTYDVIAYGADGAMTVSDPAQVRTMGGMSIIIR